MKRLILHADLNSFFASVEQQANPYLRGKPVGIIKALGRSCVIACSNEAKLFGVKTGMVLSEVKQKCPEIILVPAEFPKYFSVTRQFINLCSQYTDTMEIFSLDEVFLDLTRTEALFGHALLVAYEIQNRLKQEIGDWLGCSIGIAENKLLAKLASGMAPRKGVVFVDEYTKKKLLAQAPFEEVCGIGYRLTARLNRMGIFNLPQILATPDELLLAEFGPFWAKELKRLARGEDDSPLITLKDLADAQSVSRTYTLMENTCDQKQIKALIRNLVEEAAWKLRQLGLAGRQFGIAVRGDNLSQVGHLTQKYFLDDGREIFDQVYRLYTSWHWSHPVRFVGVWISLLTRKNWLPLPLLEQDQHTSKLLQAIDELNQRYGEHTLYPAVMLYHQLIRPEVNGYLGDKQFQFRSF
jgi:DNA polymerase-4